MYLFQTDRLNFTNNIHICWQLIRLKKRNPEALDKQILLLQKLAVNELIELVVPLAFILSFITAYYGPNSSLIGNIGNSYWQFKEVDDIGQKLQTVLMLFFTDIFSLVINSITLWAFFKVNLLKAVISIEEEFGIVFFVILGQCVSTVRNIHYAITILDLILLKLNTITLSPENYINLTFYCSISAETWLILVGT